MGYIDLGYKPGRSDLGCLFRVEPAKGITMRKACEHVALESSVGTWTKVSTSTKRIEKIGAKVFEISGPWAKIAYPAILFEANNMAQIFSSIAGNIFGMNAVKNLRLEDIHFPPIIDKAYKGPKFGVQGVRKIVGVKKRPLVGTIVKPKIGLNEKEHAKVAFEAWAGGCDVVKDDENLTDQKFNRFKKRVELTLKARDKAEKITGEKKVYMPNTTAESNEMVKRAEFVKHEGGRYAMVDVVTVGMSGVQTLREANDDLRLVLHGHRAMHGAITRNYKHGISMLALAKAYRMIGVDQLHIGTAVGKMHGGKKETVDLEEAMESKIVQGHGHVLSEEWGKIRPVFAVASGGLHPGHVQELMKILGKDIIIQMGGGIHGHPNGTRAGAKAARAAVECVMQGKELKEGKSKELRQALRKWC